MVVLVVVHKVAPDAIGTKAHRVECATGLRLVLGVPVEVTQLLWTVGELALAAVLAHAAFGIRAAQLCLVAGRSGGRSCGTRC